MAELASTRIYCRDPILDHPLKDLNGSIQIPSEAQLASGQLIYASYVHCKWLLNAPMDDQTIRITLIEYNLKISPECLSEYLSVNDGSDECAKLLSGFLCGKGRNITWTTSGPKAFIIFHTGISQYQAKAFHLKYQILDWKNMSNASDVSAHDQRYIEGRGALNCTKVLFVPLNQSTFFTVTRFEIPDMCQQHGVWIYENSPTGWTLSQKLCSQDTFVMNSSSVLIRIRSSQSRFRVSVHYGFIDKKSWKETPVLITGDSGNLYPSSISLYRETGCYDVHAWHIRAPFGRVLFVKWTLSGFNDTRGFIFVKERGYPSFPNSYSESNLRYNEIQQFWKSAWIQRDLENIAVASNHSKALANSGAVRIDYFELLFIFGMFRSGTAFSLAVNYFSMPIFLNKDGKFCKKHISGTMVKSTCITTPATHRLLKDQFATLYPAVSTSYHGWHTHYSRWQFKVDDGMYGKLSFQMTEHDYRIDECIYSGIFIEEVHVDGRLTTIGPFCSIKNGYLTLGSRMFSVVIYWNTHLDTLDKLYHLALSMVVRSTSCRGLLNNMHIQIYNITNEKCFGVQSLITKTHKASNIAYTVQSRESNVWLSRSEVYNSGQCKTDIPEVLRSHAGVDTPEVLHSKNHNQVQYSIRYNHTCHGYSELLYTEFQTAVISDCNIFVNLLKVTVQNNTFCGYLRVQNTWTLYFRKRDPPVVLVLSFWNGRNVQMGRSKELYYHLYFRVLNLLRGRMVIKEDIFDTESSRTLGMSSQEHNKHTWTIADYYNVKLNNVTLSTLRTDNVTFTFTGTTATKYSTLILDYHAHTHDSVLNKSTSQVCPDGFLHHQDYCYRFGVFSKNSARTWRMAQGECNKLNATLLSITDPTEMTVITHFISAHHGREVFSKEVFIIYIGLYSDKQVIGGMQWLYY